MTEKRYTITCASEEHAESLYQDYIGIGYKELFRCYGEIRLYNDTETPYRYITLLF